MGKINVKTGILITSGIVLSTLLAGCGTQMANNEGANGGGTTIQEGKDTGSKIAGNIKNDVDTTSNNIKEQFKAEEESIKRRQIQSRDKTVNNERNMNTETKKTVTLKTAGEDMDAVDSINPNDLTNIQNGPTIEEDKHMKDVEIKPGNSREYNPKIDTVGYTNNSSDNMSNYSDMNTEELRDYALMYVNNFIDDAGEQIKLKENIGGDRKEILSQIKFMYNKLCKTKTDSNYIVCKKLQATYKLIANK